MTLSRADVKLPHKIVHMLFIDPECHHLPCGGAFQHMEAKEGGVTSEFHPEINVVASVLREPMFGQCVEAFIAARKQTDVHIYKRKEFREVRVGTAEMALFYKKLPGVFFQTQSLPNGLKI